MIPPRKSVQFSDETNLQQEPMNTPIVNPNPVPLGEDDDNPPPVRRRLPGSTYQPSMPTSLYGYGMNPYTMNPNFGYNGLMSGYTNPMMQGNALASNSMLNGVETAGRSALESVGSVVQTLSSVSMMLQSTLFAVQNSVQAITNVAEQFTHLRSYFIESCISIIRTIKYYIRILSPVLGVNKLSSVTSVAEGGLVATTHDQYGMNDIASPMVKTDRRGIIIFFAIVIGTPYLMWRLLKSILSYSESVNNWKKGLGEHYLAEVKFSYKAVNNDELSVTCGDTIHVAPKHKQPPIKGWILASKYEKHGLVPANYIKIRSKNVDNSPVNATVHKLEDESVKLSV